MIIWDNSKPSIIYCFDSAESSFKSLVFKSAINWFSSLLAERRESGFPAPFSNVYWTSSTRILNSPWKTWSFKAMLSYCFRVIRSTSSTDCGNGRFNVSGSIKASKAATNDTLPYNSIGRWIKMRAYIEGQLNMRWSSLFSSMHKSTLPENHYNMCQ